VKQVVFIDSLFLNRQLLNMNDMRIWKTWRKTWLLLYHSLLFLFWIDIL